MKTCGKNQGKKSKEEERKNIVTYKKNRVAAETQRYMGQKWEMKQAH